MPYIWDRQRAIKIKKKLNLPKFVKLLYSHFSTLLPSHYSYLVSWYLVATLTSTWVRSHHFYLGTPVLGHYSYLGTLVPGHYSYLGTLVPGHYSYLGTRLLHQILLMTWYQV